MQKNSNTLFIQSWLRSDFFHAVAAALGSRGVVLALGFITSIFIARSLDPEGRGQVGVATTITGVGVQLGLLGFHSSNTFYVAKNPEKLSVMVSNSLILSLIIGIISMGLIYLFSHLIMKETPLPSSLLFICLANIPLSICFMLFQGLLTGIQKFKDFNLSDIFIKLGNTLLILTTLSFGTLTPLTVTLFQGIALIICLLIMIRSFAKSMKNFSFPSFKIIKENFFYGGKAYLACFFSWGVIRLDIFILQRSHGFEHVGYFSVALSLIDILLMFSTSVSAILLPKLCVEPDIQKKWLMTKRTTLGSTAVILLVAFIAFVWEAPVEWLYGSQFSPCYRVLLLLLPGFILLSVESILIQFINSISLPWSVVVIWAVSFIIKFCLSIGLIPKLGIEGLGLSWTLTYFFVFCAISLNIKLLLKKEKNNVSTLSKT